MPNIKKIKILWSTACLLNEDFRFNQPIFSRKNTTSCFKEINWHPEIAVDRITLTLPFRQKIANELKQFDILLSPRSNSFKCKKNDYELDIKYTISIVQPRIIMVALEAEILNCDHLKENEIIDIQRLPNDKNDSIRMFLTTLINSLHLDKKVRKIHHIPSVILQCEFYNTDVYKSLEKNIGFFAKISTRHKDLSEKHYSTILKKEMSAENNRHSTIVDKQGFTHILDIRTKLSGSIKKRVDVCSAISEIILIAELTRKHVHSVNDNSKHYLDYVLYQIFKFVKSPDLYLCKSKETQILWRAFSEERSLDLMPDQISKDKIRKFDFYEMLYDKRLHTNFSDNKIDYHTINYALFYHKKIHYLSTLLVNNSDKIFYTTLIGTFALIIKYIFIPASA